ncbi:MAG: hypothetical protein KatS3mg114_0115 [Planctomycetaceae bacterium]|nr:MAG: hypothetical protein KatS3mg114_0115 [Planctomycetaceae bacterium]
MITAWFLLTHLCWYSTDLQSGDEYLFPAYHTLYEFTFGPETDRDWNGVPDGWQRRTGPGFPTFVSCRLDTQRGCLHEGSLRIIANAAAAAIYSPLLRIDAHHTYYFEAAVQVKELHHDAAIITLSVLDDRRRRVQRFVSTAIVGTSDRWYRVRIGPIHPHPEAYYLVLGCHLALGPGPRHDIGSIVWFDDLKLGQLPRLEIESNFLSHFLNEEAPLRVNHRVSGLDPGKQYQLQTRLFDLQDAEIAHQTWELSLRTITEPHQSPSPANYAWETPRRQPGFYRVRAELRHEQRVLVREETTIAVLKLVRHPRLTGEFGWSLGHELTSDQRQELPLIAAQAGINWLKYPIWRTLEPGRSARDTAEVAQFFDRLQGVGVKLVGVFDTPPQPIRTQFDERWSGVAEIFRLAPDHWRSTVEPVVARYAAGVQYWQLGGDGDHSFAGIPQLEDTLSQIIREWQRMNLTARVGVSWPADKLLPHRPRVHFWSIDAPQLLADQYHTPTGQAPRWITLRDIGDADSDAADQQENIHHPPHQQIEQRAARLAQALIQAKLTQASVIFHPDIYHPQRGLLTPQGAPSELFLPWRTMALTLQQSEVLGSLPHEPPIPNLVVVQDGIGSVIFWSDQPRQASFHTGERSQLIDVWGRTVPTTESGMTRRVQATPLPQIIRLCEEPLLRWQTLCRFEQEQMRSEYGGHRDALVGRNTFPQGVSGILRLRLPEGWEADRREWSLYLAAGETFHLPVTLNAPPHTALGEHVLQLEFDILADRPYQFSVPRRYRVGLGDILLNVVDRILPDGRLEIEQIVTNRTDPEEVLDFRCALFVPHARRHLAYITRLGHGTDRKFYYLDRAEQYRGQVLWLRLEQEGGRRVLNHRWQVGQSWEETQKEPDWPQVHSP